MVSSKPSGSEVVLPSDQSDITDGSSILVRTGLNQVLPQDKDIEKSQDSIESTTEEDISVPSESKCPHPPSFFTDQNGNLKFVTLVVRNPFIVFYSILILCVVISALLIRIVSKGGNPFVVTETYDIHDLRSSAYDSVQLAIDQVEVQRKEFMQINSEELVISTKPQENIIDQTLWIYESKTVDGLFGSKDSIRAMKEGSDLFTKERSHESYCQLKYENETSECVLPFSPLTMYYASKWDHTAAQIVIDELAQDYPANVLRYNFLGVCVEFDIFCPDFSSEEDIEWAVALNKNITRISDNWDGKGELNSDIDQVTLFAAYMKELNTKRGFVEYGYDKNFSIKNLKSFYSRGSYFWGGPLGGRKLNTTFNDDEEDKDQETLKQYIAKNLLQDMNKISSVDHNPEVNSYFFMGTLILEVLFDIAKRDGLLAFFSFLFVCVYIRISLGSWFLAAVGLFEIGVSIPISWFIFSVCLRIEYFSFLNSLALFIVAAIGADDIFIFMDAYKQSATPSPEDAYILESLESRMSWVYRRTGSAMAITSATTCFAFLSTLASPLAGMQAFGVFTALVIFIDYVLVMTLFCTAVIIYHNKLETKPCCSCFIGGCCQTVNPTPTMIAFSKSTATDGKNKKNEGEDKISKFFRTKVSSFILNQNVRVCLGALFFSWMIVASIYSSKLKPTEASDQFLSEDHPLQKSFSILGEEFSIAESDPSLAMSFTWGVGDVVRKGVNQLFKPDFFGTPVFLDTFTFDEECQLEMVQVCDDLLTNINYIPYIKQVNGLGSVKCFIEEFGAYSAIGNLDNCDSVRSGAWKLTDWTVPLESLPTFMSKFLNETSCFSDTRRTIMSHYANELGWDGSKMKFAGVSVESNVLSPYTNLAETVTREQYDMMIKISEGFDATMEASCGSKTIMTDLDAKFVFMNTQLIYVRSALVSGGLGLLIAFVVLLISTRLFHLALLATLSISCVLVSVTGIMVMQGWALGSIEAILISVVAGFSVDYVVHLAHSYERVNGDTETRITRAFSEMGISVMNGMVTSVGASLPLFFCQLVFFKKFGTFLCFTIGFSWIFANFAFMAVLAQGKIPITRKNKMFGF